MEGRGRVPSKRHKEWKKAAGWEAISAKLPMFLGSYQVSIAIPKKMRGDVDGRIKLVIDLLVELLITPDDKFCEKVTAFREIGIAAGRCVVEISGEVSAR